MPAVHRDARPADYGVHIYVRTRNLPVAIAVVIDTNARSGNKRSLSFSRIATEIRKRSFSELNLYYKRDI